MKHFVIVTDSEYVAPEIYGVFDSLEKALSFLIQKEKQFKAIPVQETHPSTYRFIEQSRFQVSIDIEEWNEDRLLQTSSEFSKELLKSLGGLQEKIYEEGDIFYLVQDGYETENVIGIFASRQEVLQFMFDDDRFFVYPSFIDSDCVYVKKGRHVDLCVAISAWNKEKKVEPSVLFTIDEFRQLSFSKERYDAICETYQGLEKILRKKVLSGKRIDFIIDDFRYFPESKGLYKVKPKKRGREYIGRHSDEVCADVQYLMQCIALQEVKGE